MKIAHLTPGTGYYHCGSCLREMTLVAALRARGHDAWVVPLYLPAFPDAGALADAPRVLMGGINVYFHHKRSWMRRLPRWLARGLDSPRLLRWFARRAGTADPELLGAMTVSMLQGEAGPLREEIDRLVRWFEEGERPDRICLSNALLIGLARALRERLGVPVVCSLQGEAPFLDALPDHHREPAWELLRERAAEVDAFAAVSGWYGDLMRDRLGLDPARVHVVHNGIAAQALAKGAPAGEGRPPAIGFLARLCRDKGLHTLVEAFIALKRRGSVPELELRAAGAQLAEDRALLRELGRRLKAEGLARCARFLPNLEDAAKPAFLASLSVLSVPACYGESFGLYLLEAWAAGVPVVQPRHGAFTELLEASGGGLLCAPDDPASLALALERLLLDPAEARRLGERGREALARQFSDEKMAMSFERVCESLVIP